MIKKIIYLSLFLFVRPILALSVEAFKNPLLWHDQSIAEYLKTASIKSITPMHEFLDSVGKKYDFTNEVSLLELEGGVKAVFKPGEDSYFEKVAYKASCKLGFPFIPPTVMRTINSQEGSLQLFVETKSDLLDDEMYEQMFEIFDTADVNNLKLFYFIFGQWDSGAYNLLAYKYEEKMYPIAIDNECIANKQKVRYGELPYVRIWYDESFKTNDFDKPFPSDSYDILNKLSEYDMNQSFVKKLPEWFRAAPYNRRKYILYQNSFWCQFHAFNDKFIKSYVDTCSEKTYKILQKLDRPTLHSLYKNVLNNGLFKESQVDDILERRDQVLAFVIPEDNSKNIIPKFSIEELKNPKLWSDSSIIEYLKIAPIESIVPMRDYLEKIGKKNEFTTEVFLVSLTDGVKAVFKPGEDSYFEEVAYKSSCTLGFPFIPPTVMRTINNKKGSLQLFVETSIDLLQDGMYEKMFEIFDENDKNNLKLFYFVFGQWDSGSHNLLAYKYKEKIYPIAIDNSRIKDMQKVQYGDIPYIFLCSNQAFKTKELYEQFPFDAYKILKKALLNKEERGLLRKVPDWVYDELEDHGKYILYQEGFWCQVYAFDDSFIKSYTKSCSIETYETLQKLDRSTLDSVYKNVLDNGLFKESQIDDILERRDQALASVKIIEKNK